MKKKKEFYLSLILVLAVVIGVGYAILTTTLNIVGTTNIKDNTWDVHFENFQTTEGSVTATSAGINSNNTTEVNYTVSLAKPGDFYEFTVDAVNKGSLDAMVNSISNTGLTVDQQKYMTYSVKYADNYYNDATKTITQYHKLPGMNGTTYYYTPIKVRVEYKRDLNNADLPSTNQPVSLTFSANYVQADTNAITGNNVPSATAATPAPANPYATTFDGTYGYDGPDVPTSENGGEWFDTLNPEWKVYYRFDQTKIEACGVFGSGTVCLEANQWDSSNVQCEYDEEVGADVCTSEGYVAAKKAEMEAAGASCGLDSYNLRCIGNYGSVDCRLNNDGSVYCSDGSNDCDVYSDGSAVGHSAP